MKGEGISYRLRIRLRISASGSCVEGVVCMHREWFEKGRSLVRPDGVGRRSGPQSLVS